jgi:hypothetical protein
LLIVVIIINSVFPPMRMNRAVLYTEWFFECKERNDEEEKTAT